MKYHKFLGPVPVLLLALACGWGVVARAQDAAPAAEPASEDADAHDAKSKDDAFTIPDGGAKEIQAFMEELAQSKPQGDNDQEQAEFANKVLTTMTTAADRLLAAKPNLDQACEAYDYKMRALQLLSQLGDEKADAELVKTIAAVRADSRQPVVVLGWQSAIQHQASQWEGLGKDQRQAFQKEVLDELADGQPQAMDVSIVRAVADALEHTDDAFVVDLLSKAIPPLKDSKDAKVRKAYAQANLEGLMRRLNLLGNQMEITGTLLNGKPVDWKSYRGKVVLVDFWATWCALCRGEVPNVLALYAGYHDKGFEVLGVSLDQTPEDAHKYIDEMKIPWPSIFPKDEKTRAWDNPLVKYYDVTGIPTAILVGKDGKVVHLEARGDVLREQLQQLLGDPIEPKEADAPAGEPGNS